MGKKLHGEYSIEIFGDYCIEIDSGLLGFFMSSILALLSIQP